MRAEGYQYQKHKNVYSCKYNYGIAIYGNIFRKNQSVGNKLQRFSELHVNDYSFIFSVLNVMAAGSLYQGFGTTAYLKLYDFRTSLEAGRMEHALKFYHEAFLGIPNGVKVLDYGAGPVMMSTISAATKASDIVLAEYVESNRDALRKWLCADQEAFDWSPQFSFVVKTLEGNDEVHIIEREKKVRQIVKAVVSCDITKDPPIDRLYNWKYDVVISSLVMEAASSNLEEYQLHISRLGKLVKPGGTILYYGVENRVGFYTLANNEKYPNVLATAEQAMSAFESAGFTELSLQTFHPSHDPYRVFRSIKGTKDKEL